MKELEEESAKENQPQTYMEEEEEEEKEEIQETSDNDEDEDVDGDIKKFTLRRSAGCLLEMIANKFGVDVYHQAQPKLLEFLQSENWLLKEAGILCFGVFGRERIEEVDAQFQDIFPFLMQSLEHPEALLRSISCWTFSRYFYIITNY